MLAANSLKILGDELRRKTLFTTILLEYLLYFERLLWIHTKLPQKDSKIFKRRPNRFSTSFVYFCNFIHYSQTNLIPTCAMLLLLYLLSLIICMIFFMMMFVCCAFNRRKTLITCSSTVRCRKKYGANWNLD